ncbi:hypothetical protein IW261DRAFT_874873 [Armillaria novae-zelandiae]|uniref:Uncharacterized protein n=1 Tax=Armillaria novae-zelandiae TaxID=153914 RepID=A0AA39UJ92_9AGAR|nr:hypothetical protein IW261DRAFT_874873 [Armillaria novae-zelandiae]
MYPSSSTSESFGGGTLILRPRRPRLLGLPLPPPSCPSESLLRLRGLGGPSPWKTLTTSASGFFSSFCRRSISSTRRIISSHRPARSRSRSSRSLSRSVSRPSSRSTFFSRPRITSCAASCWARSTPALSSVPVSWSVNRPTFRLSSSITEDQSCLVFVVSIMPGSGVLGRTRSCCGSSSSRSSTSSTVSSSRSVIVATLCASSSSSST